MYARARTGLSENNLHLHTLPRNALPAGFSGLRTPIRTFTHPSPFLRRGARERKRSPFFRKRSPFLQKRSPFFRQWAPPWRMGGGLVKLQGVPKVCNHLISKRVTPTAWRWRLFFKWEMRTMYLRFNDLLFTIYVLFCYFVISPGPISRFNHQIVQL